MNFTIETVADLVEFARNIVVHASTMDEFATKNNFKTSDLEEWLNTAYSIKSYYKKYDFSILQNEIREVKPEVMQILSYIPEVDPFFVANGNYNDIMLFLKAEEHLNMLLTGPTGLGKTKMIEQLHAAARKPLIRVNLTIESDEDSLMGGFRLLDGSTFFDKGPVIKAMELGATLLLDELDLASPGRILCLQSVLEGAGYLIKKTSEFVKPAPGFTVIATANTKGSGDESGIYIATNTLNGAMMDRFPLFFECEYPSESVETKILTKALEVLNFKMPQTEIDLLVKWAAQLRTDKAGNFDLEYSISTRRLVDILKVNKVLNGDLDSAIDKCLCRFDGAHKQAFKDAYKALKPKKYSAQTEEEETETIVFDEDNNISF